MIHTYPAHIWTIMSVQIWNSGLSQIQRWSRQLAVLEVRAVATNTHTLSIETIALTCAPWKCSSFPEQSGFPPPSLHLQALCFYLKPPLWILANTRVYAHLCLQVAFPSLPKAGCNLPLSVHDTQFSHVVLEVFGGEKELPTAAERINKRRSEGTESCWAIGVRVSLCPQQLCPSDLEPISSVA
jgi:hypothetical protein